MPTVPSLPPRSPAPRRRRDRLVRAAWLAVAGLALAGVFSLYTRPAFLVTLVDQIWACF